MLWDIAFKNLWRRKLRSILAILGVAVTVQLYLALSMITAAYEQDTLNQLSTFAGKIVVTPQIEGSSGIADIISSGSSLKTETVEELLAIEGVNRSSSSAVIYVTIERSTLPYMPPAVFMVGIEPGYEEAFLGVFEAESGSSNLTGPYEVILGRNAAEFYGDDELSISTGQTIEIQEEKFNVVGILENAPQLFSNTVIIPLNTAQEIVDRSDSVSSVILTAVNIENIQTLKEEIANRFPNLATYTQDDMMENASILFVNMNRFMSLIMNSIIVVAIIAITIIVYIAVMEQRKEIGTLRAIGAKRWRIISMVAGESMILSLVGAILALPLAIFFTQWSLREFESQPGILSIWWQSIAVAVVVGLVASLLPAYRAVRMDPLESLRYE